jgi:hypothetical protein
MKRDAGKRGPEKVFLRRKKFFFRKRGMFIHPEGFPFCGQPGKEPILNDLIPPQKEALIGFKPSADRVEHPIQLVSDGESGSGKIDDRFQKPEGIGMTGHRKLLRLP